MVFFGVPDFFCNLFLDDLLSFDFAGLVFTLGGFKEPGLVIVESFGSLLPSWLMEAFSEQDAKTLMSLTC